MITRRTLAGLSFEVISPSAYRLLGKEVFIVYLSNRMVTSTGWYVCHKKNRKLLHSRPYRSVAEAASMIARILDHIERSDLWL